MSGGEAREDVAEPELGIKTEAGGLEYGVEDGATFAAAVGAETGKFLRVTAMPRSARSAGLLSIAMRPSSVSRASAPHAPSAQCSALARLVLAERRRRWASIRSRSSLRMGTASAWRMANRCWGWWPVIRRSMS